ncbi:PTS glucitol/sorbitol transporter subunit IIA [Lacticaseibacillus zeae]|uniref:PTS glucitol/sorbitol transporter subunit IIA n=1 Tax=Lacticaseibacillus zeae subsp. silagei TaxID=3068307 RepID=A0ABD7Z9M3_LACZE|nr:MULTISPECIES: PTS glucitol/sorbitol transporter subunit IIA [Lacticaseibacillus]MDE3316625.1 PTS glucitol/sorbitol transporter subunit IIA [Lacticaseibacillus zeae]OFR97219.1 PTS sorbitol transporter subunit IIA [Lactobacillus sp. HMSC068F07]WLV83417.1 PTS glucitol/sorbitol transporter subunit IIA [Lacticaseibacillus sp. NCIMB 15475]WLV86166.1 PTS glucitol/sorbitol transporter subunit IIA [Lacticaseibacillus sp. NCIMB 15474]
MSSVAEKTKYETKILEVGSDARGFKDINMAILFGDEAPDALRSSCFIIQVTKILEPIQTGDVMVFGDQAYTITAVGDEVNTNLGNLGHTAVVFDGSTTPELAGSLYLESKPYPQLDVGTVIKIMKGA